MKLVLFLLLASRMTLPAQTELPAGPVPPNARSAEVTVERGGSVEISLESDRRGSRRIRFLIRQRPDHGKLSEVRENDTQNPTIIYTHGGDASSETDQFRFAVGGQGVGYSAPATVTIRITNPPPLLRAPAELDLGRIVRGDPASEMLVLQNSGGDLLEGIISVPVPWEVKPSDAYSIKPGESSEFEVHLVNAAASTFTGTARYSSHPRVLTSLSAQVIEPFTVEPPSLQKESWNNQQSAEISVTNSTRRSHEFKITTPEGIQSPKTLTVPSGTAATVTFSVIDAIRARSATSIILSSNIGTLTIPLAVPEFDSVPEHPVSSASPEPPITSTQISPASTPHISITPTPPIAATPSPDKPLPTSAMPSTTGKSGQLDHDPALSQELGLRPQANPIATDVRIEKVTPTSVTLIWQAKPPFEGRDYVVEALLLTTDDDGELVADWVKAPFHPRSKKNGSVAVKIDQLLPEAFYRFRITSDRHTHYRDEPFSPAFAPPVLTPAGGLSGWLVIGMGLAGAVLCAGVFWRLRQNKVDAGR